jgi:multidrug efflux system membrane fusion protein
MFGNSISAHRFAAVCAFCLMVFALTGCKEKKALTAPGGPPVVPVSVAKATRESVPFELRVVGTAEASAEVQVKSQVAGQLMAVHFTEGQNVAKDALLFEVDSRPYREALRQAEAAAVRDRAQIQQAEASLARDLAQVKFADADVARNNELAAAGVVSKVQSEQVRTSADVYRESARASRAAIESARAAVQSDLAAIDKAKLDISYCQIQAQIAGRTGNLLVHAGNLVKANDVPLVVIHRVAPIFVYFSVPEQHLDAIRRLAARQALAVRAAIPDAPERNATGRLTVIDNSVDAATGTIRLKGVFENKDGLLWPGQFVNVTLTLDTIHNAIVVPAAAVQAGQQGQFVFVVKPDQTVEPRIVTTGRTVDRKMIIEKGVGADETVVTDGHLRLFPGAKVKMVDPGKIEAGSF